MSTRQLLLLLLLLLLRAVVGSRDWAALGCIEIDGATCCRPSGRASWISRRAGVGPARMVVGRTAAGGERRRRGGADSHAASRRSRLGSQLSGGDVASPARAGAEHSTAHSDDRAEPLRAHHRSDHRATLFSPHEPFHLSPKSGVRLPHRASTQSGRGSILYRNS